MPAPGDQTDYFPTDLAGEIRTVTQPVGEVIVGNLGLLLKESWAHVEARIDTVAQHVYASAFLRDPDLRELFPIEMAHHRTRWVDAMATAIQTIDDPERFTQYLETLGSTHRRFHVQEDHYDVLGDALLGALRSHAGEYWCIEYDQAWRDGYAAIAAAMRAGAAKDADQPAYWHAEVTRHERRGRDVAVFTSRPLSPFAYQAGQYVSVECRYQPRHWRSYSIANAPRHDGTIDFQVRARGDGWVSAALVRKLRTGDMIRLSPAMGSMTLDRHSTRDLVCVAGGTGLAPLKALVEEFGRYNRSRWVHLFVGANDQDELYDLATLRLLEKRFAWLSVIPVCADDPHWPGEKGPVAAAVTRRGPWANHDAFVSGPPSMVRATVAALVEAGVTPVRIRYDAVSTPEPPTRSG